MSRDSDITAPTSLAEDNHGPALRPTHFDSFIGQDRIKANLCVFIEAALRRGEALDHVLLSGPPGLGKTTLAHITAQALGTHIRTTAGPVIARAGDLAALLTNMQSGDVLFIDEIHRLSPAIEEILYPAMEDQVLDVMIGEGPSARSVRIDLPPFTLIGATTRSGLLTTPLRDRFGIPLRLEFYQAQELATIIELAAERMNIHVHQDAAWEIAHRARGTPRIAIRLLRRARDFAETENAALDRACVCRALARLEVDTKGLDTLDRHYLQTLAQTHAGGPVGLDTLAATLSETRDAVEDVIEPYLLQEGFVARTPRGRMATQQTYKHLGLSVPQGSSYPLFAKAKAEPDS